MSEARVTDYAHLRVEPLTSVVGAEILDVDLSTLPPDAVMRDIEQALMDWGVVFFRDQDISTEAHIEFSRWFGELEVHPFAPHKEGYPEVLVITHDEEHPPRENLWHSDVTWRLQPSLGSVLRAIEVPKFGGDTLFANMSLAYERLPDELKEKIEGKRARHDFNGFRRGLLANGASQEEIEAFNQKYPNPEHPVVRTHPVTGAKSLYVNTAFTKEIIGLSQEESDALLPRLYAQAANPDVQCRFRWAPGSIAFWDNRAVQHFAAADYWPQRRAVERVTICGDTPV